jgi:hypothetical protein
MVSGSRLAMLSSAVFAVIALAFGRDELQGRLVLRDDHLAEVRGGDAHVACAVHYSSSAPTGCNSCDYAGLLPIWVDSSGGGFWSTIEAWKRCIVNPSSDTCITGTGSSYASWCDLVTGNCPSTGPGTAYVFLDQYCENQLTATDPQVPDPTTSCAETKTYDAGTTTPDAGLAPCSPP